MDIKLSGQDSMKTAQQLRSNGSSGQIIFVTAYDKYVFRAFDVDAVHYILNPVNTSQLYSALDKALKHMVHDTEKTLLILNRNITSRIPIRDILYCEVFNHQVSIYTMTEEYIHCGTLDAIEKELDNRFFRCHRSFLVNMDFVIHKEAGTAIISGGHKVLVSRRKQQEFARKLLGKC